MPGVLQNSENNTVHHVRLALQLFKSPQISIKGPKETTSVESSPFATMRAFQCGREQEK